MYFFAFAELGWQCLTWFSEIEDRFYGSGLQETNQRIYSMKISSRFSWVVSNGRCFSNWCWLFKPSRFLVSYSVIFRVGSTWLTVLPLQIWRTYNNQYPRPLETLPSLQGCPIGLGRSIYSNNAKNSKKTRLKSQRRWSWKTIRWFLHQIHHSSEYFWELNVWSSCVLFWISDNEIGLVLQE